MTNLEKKLDALIDALGFYVEEVDNTKSIAPEDAQPLRLRGFPVDDVYDMRGTVNGRHVANAKDIDYKLTKKSMDNLQKEGEKKLTDWASNNENL